jgi:hypothetical protein
MRAPSVTLQENCFEASVLAQSFLDRPHERNHVTWKTETILKGGPVVHNIALIHPAQGLCWPRTEGPEGRFARAHDELYGTERECRAHEPHHLEVFGRRISPHDGERIKVEPLDAVAFSVHLFEKTGDRWVVIDWRGDFPKRGPRTPVAVFGSKISHCLI